MQFVTVQTFDDWRAAARAMLRSGVQPSAVRFSAPDGSADLFAACDAADPEAAPPTSPRSPGPPRSPGSTTSSRSPARSSEAAATTAAAAPRVPKAFLDLARTVACHRDPGRWQLLYRTLWRISHDEPFLLRISTDDDVLQLRRMEKAVTRDVHKMKAFVRFRKVTDDTGGEAFVAWHRPDHQIMRLAAPFFSRRFRGMRWTILTPHESATWDGTHLQYGDGVPASEAPEGDELEQLWKTYYGSIFNPARLKVRAMKREMPVRHWPTLPEAELIADLLSAAPGRAEAMIQHHEGFADTATKFMPADRDLPSLRQAAARCHACDLHRCATQTVFGEGPAGAQVMFVGEQPGDQEDLVGRPFVGPAGQLLDQALAQADVDRGEVYVTNVVKHFKFKPSQRGKRRLHQKPNSREIFACRPWLEAEIAEIQPQSLVCLGATPAQAIFGRDFRISRSRGKVFQTEWSPRTIATWHPAAILRMPDAGRAAQMREQLIQDLQRVAVQ